MIKSSAFNKLLTIIFLAFGFNSCSNKAKVIRDLNINIIVLNANQYNTVYKPFIESVSIETYQKMVSRMKNSTSISDNDKIVLSDGTEANFPNLYDNNDANLKKQIFNELTDGNSVILDDNTLKEKLDIDVLQPILFFTSAQYFKDEFALDLTYHPPVEFSGVFKEFFNEINQNNSTEVKFINPYAPLCQGLEEKGAIYHAVLYKPILKKMYNFLLKQKDAIKDNFSIKKDYLFLETLIKSSINEDTLFIIRMTP